MTALYYRDKDSGEYQKLGDGKIEEIGEISEDNDVVDERFTRFLNCNQSITFTVKPPKIIDTTARETE
jgi:hypothetical protein